MWELDAPETTLQQIIEACISNMQDEDLSKWFLKAVESLEELKKNYFEYAIAENLHEIEPVDNIDGVSIKKRMIGLYTDKLAKLGQPGRIFYDLIITAAKQHNCPFCRARLVESLDHVLPKTKFPEFAVTPINLVPACDKCNEYRFVEKSVTGTNMNMHPYFDKLGDATWLVAQLHLDTEVTFSFSVEPSKIWSDELRQRMTHHFQSLHLNDLYSVHASAEFREIFPQLLRVFDASGQNEAELTNWLTMRHSDMIQVDRNYWKAAIYKAMIKENWFVSFLTARRLIGV
jgi:hypothetical protein